MHILSNTTHFYNQKMSSKTLSLSEMQKVKSSSMHRIETASLEVCLQLMFYLFLTLRVRKFECILKPRASYIGRYIPPLCGRNSLRRRLQFVTRHIGPPANFTSYNRLYLHRYAHWLPALCHLDEPKSAVPCRSKPSGYSIQHCKSFWWTQCSLS